MEDFTIHEQYSRNIVTTGGPDNIVTAGGPDNIVTAGGQVVRRFRQNMIFGLKNNNNLNNCFINCVIQNIWHLNGFKFILREAILAKDTLDKGHSNIIMYELATLLKAIKEGEEGAVYSVTPLKQAVLTEMFGAGNYESNEQADA